MVQRNERMPDKGRNGRNDQEEPLDNDIDMKSQQTLIKLNPRKENVCVWRRCYG